MLSLLITLTLLAPAQDQDAQPRFDGRPAKVTLDGPRARVPFTLGGGRPVPLVEARINGEGPFKLYFDTGASVCVLHEKFVERMGIPILGATTIGDHTDSARLEAQEVRIDAIELGGVRFEGVPAIAFDRSSLRGDEIPGVLGLPLFADHLLTVDYVNGRLGVSSERLPKEGPGIIAYGDEGPLPEISLGIHGEEHLCHVDTGSPSGFMLPTKVVDGLPTRGEPVLLGKARTVNSEFEIWSVQLDVPIVLAGREYPAPTVSYSDILPSSIVGYQVLKDLELSIDQRTKRMRLREATKDEDASAPAPVRRRLGAGIAVAGDQLSISQVIDGTPAATAGLKPGDVLVEIDGEVASRATLEAALERTGPVRVLVTRGEERVALVLYKGKA